MKKIFNILLISILTILFIPNVYAANSMEIESINLVDKSEKTTEISTPSVNGLKIGFDLSFSDVGDYAKYEVVVNNSTNKEYEIKDETTFSSSNYIEYKYEFKEKTNRIKANSKVTLYITVTYKNAVPADKLTDGKYIENNEMAISLSNQDNPKTFNNFIYLLLVLLSLIVITLVIKNKKVKSLSIIVIALLLVPTTIFALEKLKLDVATKITIEKKYKVTFITYETIKKSEAIEFDDGIWKRETASKTVSKNDQTADILNGMMVAETRLFINGEEYINYPVVKEEMLYKAGATVNVKNYSIVVLSNKNNCPYADGIYTCQESDLVTINTDIGGYLARYNKRLVQPNDPQVMNFQNILYDEWNSSSPSVAFNTPSTFTMPEHDVVIILEKSVGEVSH